MYFVYSCPKGHDLKWTDTITKDYTEEYYSCDKCGITLDCSLKRWWCDECIYDICSSCLPHHIDPLPQLCTKGHDLVWETKSYPGKPHYICKS